MKKEYDFSKGVRGKFHNPDGELNLPVYPSPRSTRAATYTDQGKAAQAQADKLTAERLQKGQ